MTLRLCTYNCSVEHYENCGTCFGFGIKDVAHIDGLIPLSASDASEIRLCGTSPVARIKRCPECGSNYNGIPRAKTAAG